MSTDKKNIRIGSRKSPLALAQVDEILSSLSAHGIQFSYELFTQDTLGDLDKKISLIDKNVTDNFFTDTLDQGLLNDHIDIAVHSAKDLPKEIPEGLEIFALTSSLDETDAFVGKKRLADLPSGAKVGTSSLIRKRGILKINPQVQVVDIRGTIAERLKLLETGACDGIVVATCALKRLKIEHEIREILPWETTPLQGQLAIVGRTIDRDFKKMFSTIDARRQYGKVLLVGAGPGDPELITIKATKFLKKADCVFYDYLSHKDLLLYAPQAEKIYVGKRKGNQAMPQADLCRILKQTALAGKTVVRLKGGDPLIFGRGAEEIEYLRAYHITVEVIPGVSSATGLPSSLGIPLTARDISSSVAFLSGYGKEEEETTPQPIKIPDVDTLVFFMGLTKLENIVQACLAAGRKKTLPVMIISQGTTITEDIVAGTLENIQELSAQGNLKPPALIIIGNVVNFRKFDEIHRRESVLYLGTHPEKYKSLGKIIHHPMIEISPIDSESLEWKTILRDLSAYDIILLTSPWAVYHFFDLLAKNKIVVTDSSFAVIGQDTAFELTQKGVSPSVVARDESSSGLLQSLKEVYALSGKKILFPRSSLPNPYLKEELIKHGCQVTELTVYRNTKPSRRELPSVPIHKIFFTSPSTVRNFLADYGKISPEWQILSKGPRTYETLKAAGYSSEMLVFD